MRSEKFQNEVDLKYKLYNSIFLTLPLDGIHGTGILIPILKDECSKGLEIGKSPIEIFNHFFEKQTSFRTEKEQFDFMFRVIHFIERQVVLLDAVEDAVFDKMNDLNGAGSLKALKSKVKQTGKWESFKSDLEKFAVRVVLTAHPTQFYPSTVLAIINDLIRAIQKSDLLQIKLLLTQLGKTPFLKKERPTPYDEAKNLSWYLENIFYQSASNLYSELVKGEGMSEEKAGPVISFGFWPGGDRDGNPYVNTETTLKVAARLRYILFSNYYKDLRVLRRRLSFKGVQELIVDLEERVLIALNDSDSSAGISVLEITDYLNKIEKILVEEHDGFFLDLLKKFQNKVKLFGAHFANIDIRQDSRIIGKAFQVLRESSTEIDRQIGNASTDSLFKVKGLLSYFKTDDEVSRDTISVFSTIKEIQEKNGEAACNRFIISNCQTSVDVARVYAMAKLCAWEEGLPLDIVPLFETIDDLAKADETMRELFENEVYYQHLVSRGKKQTIMLGFSDGTKDGGYFSANWSIYKAKENITRLAREKGIVVVFFDGRGGPPARGGGNTHKFYSSLGNNIENQEIQVTIQGQTISSKFGTKASAKYYQELLITAGLGNRLFEDQSKQFCAEDREIMEALSKYSLEEYQRFKSSDKFVPYLEKMSALKYYGEAKIGSRPSKRNASATLNFEDLRAIPFVGAWSQMKQNVPGFFGVGASIKRLKDEGRMEACKHLYQNSLFFRTLVENSMQSISKSHFSLTQYMQKDEEFGEFWNWIYREYQLSIDMLLEVSGQKEIMELSLELKDSIQLREEIVLPLICIQQFALMKIREMDLSGNIDQNKYNLLQSLVIRSLYGNINASRNSA
ncbi:phosphoenolpyruvate carboxylase [Labilibaculum filiforme]|uniref:Phosphoenolpyruvate carboxylase n=1 Tax=Labilibaculum filiforme TaxID=1940526 RepID=A0A2N3HT47_9BACT|nr:phosphoenolpyruvate carboxylase [Labilibaculum filiforme]PKQ61228.1 phosphoenolpyruvate carboxylase [Labilibaculum filiforme]